MTVTCPSCNTSLTIPDERLPKGQVVTAACPKCKGKIVIDTTPPAAAPSPAAATVSPLLAEEPAAYAEQAQPRALVCVADPADRDNVLTTLKREGYATQAATDAADAKEHLQFTAYALVVLRDGFGSPAGDSNPVLDYLSEMGMARRRTILVVFVSPDVRSHDPATAFARSVNLVLHVNDMPHLADALKRSHAEMEQTFRVLLESLRAMGKG